MLKKLCSKARAQSEECCRHALTSMVGVVLYSQCALLDHLVAFKEHLFVCNACIAVRQVHKAAWVRIIALEGGGGGEGGQYKMTGLQQEMTVFSTFRYNSHSTAQKQYRQGHLA